MNLPVLASASDFREAIKFLAAKPEGVTITEARDVDAVKKRVFDSKKVAAYQFCGFIVRDGERLMLTHLGKDLARKLEREAEAFLVVLDKIKEYRIVLAWAYHQNLSVITSDEVVAQWREHQPESLGVGDDDECHEAAVCFFQLCHAAALGALIIGKRGQPARLRLRRDKLINFIEDGCRQLPELTTLTRSEELKADETNVDVGTKESQCMPFLPSERPRVFVSANKTTKVIEQLLTTLELVEIEGELIGRANTPAGVPINEYVSRAMRQCQAGIIVITHADCELEDAGGLTINKYVLLEIGAAFVLYKGRVLLLCEESVPLTDCLQNLARSVFEGASLGWDEGLRLVETVKGFVHPNTFGSRRFSVVKGGQLETASA